VGGSRVHVKYALRLGVPDKGPLKVRMVLVRCLNQMPGKNRPLVRKAYGPREFGLPICVRRDVKGDIASQRGIYDESR